MKISHVQIGKPKGFDLLRQASGKITVGARSDGYKGDQHSFRAREYVDHKGGQRGAEPTRWAVFAEIDLTLGQKVAIARRLNWLLNHCRFCQHTFNATECYHCKFDGGPCRRKGKCKPFWR